MQAVNFERLRICRSFAWPISLLISIASPVDAIRMAYPV
jgi:hypothetical protein